MTENLRVLFSLAWLLANGFIFASFMAVVFTWGDYVYYFLGSVALWLVATAGAVATSLD